MRKIGFALIALIIAFTGCKKESSEFKVAFVYVGSVNDGGWTTAHDEGRLEIEKMFPGVKTAYVENVPEGADAERVLTTFANKGYNVIFTTSFGFMDPTINVAAKFPKTTFMHCAGYKRTENTGTYYGRMYQAKYLAGIIAGKMSVKGKIGYVAPHPIPEVIRHINAFTIGVREANPKATVKVIWTNSWFDIQKEKEASYSLIEVGCDLLVSGCDSSASLTVAEEKGVLSIGYDSDSRDVAKNTFLTAPMWNWISVYSDVITKAMNNSISDYSEVDYWDGFSTGVVRLAPMTDLVLPEVQELIQAKQIAFENGVDTVFVGPLKKQDGSQYLAAEERASDGDLLSVMFFVEGVDGLISSSN